MSQRESTRYVLKDLKKRCLNSDNKDYHNYGGRGITIDPRWCQPNGVGLRFFIEDMGLKPEGKELDRINNDLGYFKENCRWVTRRFNSLNKRIKNKYGYPGVKKTQYGKYVAKININGKRVHLGTFTTPESAGAAYMQKFLELEGNLIDPIHLEGLPLHDNCKNDT